MQKSEKEWFATWFGSRYYDLLYGHRDGAEAKDFIVRLLSQLDLRPGSKILDLACGWGRHSLTLAHAGFQVTGMDLSPEFIARAQKLVGNRATFKVQDMRDFLGESEFDGVLNLFTSFGYFEDEKDNETVLYNIHLALRQHGLFVLDYLNPEPILKLTQVIHDLEIEAVKFHIEKKIIDDRIIKEIQVDDQGKIFSFCEKVQLFNKNRLEEMIRKTGMRILKSWGDYQLNPYDKENSPRIILLAEKPMIPKG